MTNTYVNIETEEFLTDVKEEQIVVTVENVEGTLVEVENHYVEVYAETEQFLVEVAENYTVAVDEISLRHNYSLSRKVAVPAGSSGLFLSIDDIPTSASPLDIPYNGVLNRITARFNKLTDEQYAIDVIDSLGATIATLNVPSNVKAVDADFDVALADGDELTVKIRRVTGSGKSSFYLIGVNLFTTETQ